MKAKWEVQQNIIGGERMYIASRIRDTSAVVHSGNLEYSGGYTRDREEAEATVEQLNEVPNE